MEKTYECCGVPKILFGSFVGQNVPRNGVKLGPYPIKLPEDCAVIACGPEKRMEQIRKIAYGGTPVE